MAMGDKQPAADTLEEALLEERQRRLEEDEAETFTWQERLSEPCSEAELIEAARHLQPRHYAEILEERDANGLCGYPLCRKPPRVGICR